MIMIGAQAQTNQRARIRYNFGLPGVRGLVADHRRPRGRVPFSAWLPAQIVVANQSLLNFAGAVILDILLAARTPIRFPFIPALAARSAKAGCFSVRMSTGRVMNNRMRR